MFFSAHLIERTICTITYGLAQIARVSTDSQQPGPADSRIGQSARALYLVRSRVVLNYAFDSGTDPAISWLSMPSRDQFIETLLEFPLVQALGLCARRLRLRFALRGGVLRNHLFTLASKDAPPAQFYDYIDPFSDIDLVLEDLEDWPRLAQVISESVPFSGFHRWEVAARGVLYETSKQFAPIAPDRLLLWFDGRSGDASDITVDGLGVDAEETIRQPSLSAKSLAEKSVPAPAFTDVLDLLRLARYSFAFPRIAIDVEPQSLLERINAFSRVEPLWRERSTARSDLRRLEIALLDLIFTAHDWDTAVEFVNTTIARFPSVWSESAPLLRRLLDEAVLSAGTGVGVLLYKQAPQSALSTDLFTNAAPPPSQLGNTKSLVPWVRMSSYGHNPNDCCNYRDFENGVATVAWRTKDSSRTLSDTSSSEIAVIAAVEPLTQEDSLAFRNDPLMLSLPGFVHKGQSFTVRVDHGYVRSYLNRNASFYLGVVPVSDAFNE